MITHKAFTAHLKKILVTARLHVENSAEDVALASYNYAVYEIGHHGKNTNNKPLELVAIERDVFREAFQLQRKIISRLRAAQVTP